MAKADTEAAETHAKDYPRTVQVREEQFTWYFAKKQCADDIDAVELSHIEVRGHDFAPIKRFPWNLPDDIRDVVENKGYSVIA